MTTKEKDSLLQQSMFSLLGNDSFQNYVEVYLRDLREFYIREASSPKAVKNERLTAYYLGKVEAISEQVDQYDSWKNAPSQQVSEE